MKETDLKQLKLLNETKSDQVVFIIRAEVLNGQWGFSVTFFFHLSITIFIKIFQNKCRKKLLIKNNSDNKKKKKKSLKQLFFLKAKSFKNVNKMAKMAKNNTEKKQLKNA